MWTRIGAALGALAVVLGAFGAHALEGRVDEHLRTVWDTGARYHLVHAVALVALGAHPNPPPATGWLWTMGIVVFSGSLYAMTLSGVRILGAITPLGGLCFIAGWLWLAWKTAK